LPTCQIICCIIHFAQNWFKKIQQNPVLHKHYMNNNSEIGDCRLKCFFGLPLLPSDQIQYGFTELMSICPTDISDFSYYVLNNYIIEDAKFPPLLWAKEPTDEPRRYK